MDDLQREFNRRVLLILERLTGVATSDREVLELRELQLTMELTDKLKSKPAPAPPGPGASVDWWKLTPLLLTLALVLAAVVAALLGVDLRSLL